MPVTVSDRGSPPEQHSTVATLPEAHELLLRQQPSEDANPLEWVSFHRYSATVYSKTAAIDQRHRREALCCAGMEIRKARDIEHRLDPQLDDEEF